MASVKLYLRLTDACNLACTMCGQARRRATNSAPAVFLDEDRVRGLVERLPARVSFAYLWGGEPLLHPGCESLVELMKAQSALVEINTNGMLLEQRAQSLAASNVDRIIISIDGPPAIHDRIRGAAGSFERIRRGVEALEALRLRTGRGPALAANVTISDHNGGQLAETVEVCRGLGLKSVAIRLPIWMTPEAAAGYEEVLGPHGVTHSPALRSFIGAGYGGSPVGLRAELERLRSGRFPEVDIPSWYFHEGLIARYCSARESELWDAGRCVEARRHFNVEPDGSIVLCCDFPDLVIGSLEDPPAAALASDIRRALLERRSSPCQRCCSFHPAAASAR